MSNDRFPPRALRAPVSLSAEVSDGEGMEHAPVVNMSASGALVDLVKPVAIGDQVSVRIEVPGMSAVETQGTVARVDGTYVGVAFDEVDERDAEVMSYHVMGRRPDQQP